MLKMALSPPYKNNRSSVWQSGVPKGLPLQLKNKNKVVTTLLLMPPSSTKTMIHTTIKSTGQSSYSNNTTFKNAIISKKVSSKNTILPKPKATDI